jgi:hypothetical protein
LFARLEIAGGLSDRTGEKAANRGDLASQDLSLIMAPVLPGRHNGDLLEMWG